MNVWGKRESLLKKFHHEFILAQGFPVMTLAKFEEVLSMISTLAMKGSFLVGELPAWLIERDIEVKASLQLVDKLFMSEGFRVEMINYKGVAKSFGKDFARTHNINILFVAEQLRHSDHQVRNLIFYMTWVNIVCFLRRV